jgi:hypothetical protein
MLIDPADSAPLGIGGVTDPLGIGGVTAPPLASLLSLFSFTPELL